MGRKHGLFVRKHGERRWTRFRPLLDGSKEQILRISQGWLIFGCEETQNMERSVRPLPKKKDV